MSPPMVLKPDSLVTLPIALYFMDRDVWFMSRISYF